MNTTTDLEIPHKVRAYALTLSSPQYQTDPQDYDLREMWLEINANPYYPPTGLDWAEVLADWESGYVYDPSENVNVIIGGLREVAERYLEQTEYGECVACDSGAWVNHEGKCSECDGSH